MTPRTIRGRSVLAGVMLLIVFGGMAALAILRTGSDRGEHAALEEKSRAAAALQETRAQFYLSSTLLASAALSSDPLPLIDSYQEAVERGGESLEEAEAAFVATGDSEALASLQVLRDELNDLRPTLDALITYGLSTDTDTARGLAFDYLPQLWPTIDQILNDLGQLARAEQAKLTDETAQANSAANTSLWMLVTIGTAGLLIVIAVLTSLIRPLVRPLASLRESVHRVTSGDMKSPAAVAGPEELASLASDFNEMICQLNGATEQMRHRLDVESAVARASALLDSSEDLDAGLNSVLKTLAEAVDAEHAYIFMFKDGNTKMDNTHEWNMAGIVPQKDRFVDLDCTVFDWWTGKLIRNEGIVLNNISDLPAAAPERTLLESVGGKSALAVPFGPAGKPDGFVGFGDTRFSHVWQDEDVKLLRLASESVFSFINRQRFEQALRDSEQRFRSLSAAAPVGIFLTNATGASVYVNKRLLEISSMSLDQALGLGWLSAVHPDDRNGVIKEKERANAAGDEFAEDFRIVAANGDVRWVNVRSKPMGSLGARVGTLEDITERKRAEDALRESEERFRTLGASAPIGIFHSNAVGKVMFVNQRFVEIAGTSFPDETDRNWYDVVHPADRDWVMRDVVNAIKSRGEFAKEFRLLMPTGLTRWVSARARDMRDSGGRFIGLMGTIEDITERKQAEDALRQSEERFRSLSASAPVGIFLTDENNALSYTNECLHDIVGLNSHQRLPEADIDFTLATFVHPDDRKEVTEAHAEALRREPYEFLREFRIVTRQREERWVRVHVIPILSANGSQHPGRVGTVEDITEHKTLEQERQSAYERTTLLLAMAAEARDPYTEHHLYRIRGYSEAIALQMGLDAATAKKIGLASLLHDIGKTRVPDAILTKPGPLTEEEWQVIRRHTVWGQELLPANEWFTTARQIARSHHENWDGTGYPDGLAGEKIPLAAAIVAVADGFDAMTSKRPYKGAWPPARAMRELGEDKGYRYSPEVVEAFERAAAEGAIARIAAVRRSNLSDLVKAA